MQPVNQTISLSSFMSALIPNFGDRNLESESVPVFLLAIFSFESGEVSPVYGVSFDVVSRNLIHLEGYVMKMER